MDCAPEWAPGRESSLRSAGWASKALEKRCIWPLVGTFEHDKCLLNSYG